ncbi:DMT family transporter [Cognatishimia maritima]|uniref:EamA domain-containing membrane protein RarD n=1 Tax=Cognatishimia maritima TaxID=870908 RepID=A0A1M5T922_9RHOB|nr:DMT family transporter [Cognatishimia maritima]SHH47110.1 EamA domain-containing membrane protein RarD [Cognatishimia maritima]
MNPTKGIIFKVSALFLFAIMASLIKATSDHVPSWQAVFFRAFFAMPVILIWLAQRGELRTGLRVSNPWGHFWRGVIGTTAMAFGFAGLGLLPFPEVTAIGFASPLLIVILAALLLGEKVRIFRLSAVFVGLIGVGIILYPRITVFGSGGAESLALLGAVFVLASAAFRALAQVHIRKLVQTDQTSAIVFYFSLTSSLLGLCTIPLGWVMPTTTEVLFMIGAGLIGGIAQILLTSGYRYAEASLLAPFDYTSMIFAVVIGYFVFSEIPTSATLTGSAIIITAGIAIIWREHHLGLKRGKARPSVTPQG